MDKNEAQKLHIKISIYQYSIILFLSLFGVILAYTNKDVHPSNQFIEGYPFVIVAFAVLSMILRFIPDIIYRKYIFIENFAIKIFLDYFCRISVIAISFACAVLTTNF